MKKTLLILLASVLAVCSAFASGRSTAPEREYIWPQGLMPDVQSHQIAAMTDESKTKKFNPSAHTHPYLEWFEAPAPEKHNGGCAILISGGGYSKCCDVELIRQWRERMTELGFQCVNFVYRTPRPKGLSKHTTAWQDIQRVIRIVRNEATGYGLDPEKRLQI